MAQVEVDEDQCVGSGNCVFAAPDVFEVGEEGVAVVLDANPQGERANAVEAAVRACPAVAISMTRV